MFCFLNVRKCYLSGGNNTLESQLVWRFLRIPAFLADRVEIASEINTEKHLPLTTESGKNDLFFPLPFVWCAYYYYLTVNSFLEIVFKVNLELIWLEVEKVEKAWTWCPLQVTRSILVLSTDLFAGFYSSALPFFSPLPAMHAICWTRIPRSESVSLFYFEKISFLFNSLFTLFTIVICSGQKHACI